MELVKLRNFQKKQSENGKKGGRPKENQPEPGNNPGVTLPSQPFPNPSSVPNGLRAGFKGRFVRIPAKALGRLSSRYPDLDLWAELKAMDRKAVEEPAFRRKKDWVLAAHAWLKKARSSPGPAPGGRSLPGGDVPARSGGPEG